MQQCQGPATEHIVQQFVDPQILQEIVEEVVLGFPLEQVRPRTTEQLSTIPSTAPCVEQFCRRFHAAGRGKHRRGGPDTMVPIDDVPIPHGVGQIFEQRIAARMSTLPCRVACSKLSLWARSFQEDITERIVERIVDDAVVALQTREQIVEVGPNLPQEQVRRRNIAQIFVLPGTQVGEEVGEAIQMIPQKEIAQCDLRTDR